MAMKPTMMGQLDTAQTAAQPQAADPDAEVFATLTAGLREHVYGKGEQGIVEAMKAADDPGRVMGELVFALVQEAAHQAEAQGAQLTMDILMGVATELIDDITELMEAYGMPLDDKAREYALLYAQQLYVDNSNPSADERRAAQQDLSVMQQDGSLDTAVSYVQQRGTEAGVDPFGVEQMGEEPPGMMGRK